MKINWSGSAIKDLEALRVFIARENPDAAAEIALRIVNSVDILDVFPAAGRSGRVTGTRELVVAGTPYLVPYRVQRDRIEVLRVIHSVAKMAGKVVRRIG